MSKVRVFIPVYGQAGRLSACLKTLGQFAPDAAVHILDDATPSEEIRSVAKEFQAVLPGLKYFRQGKNRGFVQTCNAALAELKPEEDLLLLNSDTEVTEDFLSEMSSVLHLDTSHAIVMPRSNDASLVSVPPRGGMDAEASFQLWSTLRELLPRFQTIPTAVGFCMLVRGSVVRQFGLFDEAYGPGYNEENDLACRLQRLGFRSVMANRAFVYHHHGSSFGTRALALEQRNRELLVSRYPEYLRTIPTYFETGLDPLDHFAELFVAGHRARLLYDLTHLELAHTEAGEFALELLARVSEALIGLGDFHVVVKPEVQAKYSVQLAGLQCSSLERLGDALFDLAFRPAPVSSNSDFCRLTRQSLRWGFFVPDRKALCLPSSLEMADFLFTLKESVAVNLEGYSSSAEVHHIPLTAAHRPLGKGTQVLILAEGMGDSLLPLVVQLRKASPLIVITDEATKRIDLPDVTWELRKDINDSAWIELLENSKAAVVPGIATGYCKSVLDGLDLGVPIFARNGSDLAGFAGVRLFDDPNEVIFDEPTTRASGSLCAWGQVASQVHLALERHLHQPPRPENLRARWHEMRKLL